MSSIGAPSNRPNVYGFHGSVPRVDWKAYFAKFVQLHGKPVLWGGTHLFPDGARYSSSDYSGPEWRPPTEPDKLKSLQLAYWRRRQEIVQQELTFKKRRLADLQEERATRLAPLQQTRTEIEPGHNGSKPTVKRESMDLDLDGLEQRITWLEEDLVQCKQQLQELESESEVSNV